MRRKVQKAGRSIIFGYDDAMNNIIHHYHHVKRLTRDKLEFAMSPSSIIMFSIIEAMPTSLKKIFLKYKLHMETIRDSAFGKIVRVLSNARYFQYPEEIGNETCKLYFINDEQIKNKIQNAVDETEVGGYAIDTLIAQASRHEHEHEREDPEAAIDARQRKHDFELIGWSNDHDSEVSNSDLALPHADISLQYPQNWSLRKKIFVSCQIWFLTFSVYIGSAVYSPGIPGVSAEFNVSEVAATVGLTLYVFGYGIGRSPK
jgi:DHA1 family multidrug resistance protein-like MFS transporter